ncbi:transcription initiation factor TFIID subunit 7 [Beauveria bassiana ARSEF 2860]|uniref:Transcription initiation factor TFIID subunit 7 n=1 Tax=Beauveria bassiana (strain ARSEF 2860) TaxID=655819 RepID=J5JYU8_BEAB2|nr:transcription initiation factor TFIID subunit 7 [Beauveria bassiana ARSEF 2860]EJP69598.1 transcription initiation factor TFIID subunit 7 [Beauveria bassiana ARSEF 2860]
MADAGPGTPAGPPKPRLKINVNRSTSFITDTPPSAAAATPGEGGGSRKVKLKLSGSTPATPGIDHATPVKTKAGRQSKPTQKLVESKKRQRDEDDDDDAPLAASAPPATKIKIRQAKAAAAAGGGAHTQLVLKARGRPPVHPPGDGYDSEASDRELDPAIEEQFILRMVPGEHSDYVRAMMEAGKVGVSRQQGGAQISLKFFDEESRRAVVTVKGQMFAAVMVDLPTITESMKTWDKKSFLKSADVCQMLLVFQMVKTEEEAKKATLPSVVDAGSFKWPHGLTPPMHDCVNRRFAKTISRKEIEDKEQEVERLLGEDAMADRTAWEWVDEGNNADGGAGGAEEEEEDAEGEDAEGELDDSMGYFGAEDADGDLDLEADLEAAFADDMVAATTAETPATGVEDLGTPLMTTQGNTPAVHPSIEMDESEEDESDEDDNDDDDDDDDDDEDMDEDERAARDEAQGVRDFINDLRKQLAHRRADLEKTQNKILRQRLESQIKQLRSEIELKMSSIGMEVDD